MISEPDVSSQLELNNLQQQISTMESIMNRLQQENNNLSTRIMMLEQKLEDCSFESLSDPSVSTDIVPQLDGHDDLKLNTPSYKCETCDKPFSTQEQVNAHEDQYMCPCEDCKLCFDDEFEHDVHEHALHTEEYFKYNSLTPRRKREAYKRLSKLYP